MGVTDKPLAKYNLLTPDHSPHIPRRGAPQAQGPVSDGKQPLVLPLTAKTESSFSRLELLQEVHSRDSDARRTIFSNTFPQS